MDDNLKQTRNVFRKLIRDDKSVLYAVNRNKTLLSKAKKSPHKKNKIFCKSYFDFENKNPLHESSDDNSTPKKKSSRIPFYTPFAEQRKHIDRLPAVHCIKAPFEFLHADIADIRFFSKSAVNPRSRLLAVDLFMPKTYTYPIKSKHLLTQKLNVFYRDIEPLQQIINNDGKRRLQTDLEFQQNEIKRLNEKCNTEMFSSQVHGGKAYIAEQKIRELKKNII